MIDFILWYLLILILGFLTFPIVFSLFPKLADKGYAFSRTVGLLIWGFAFWFLSSVKVLENSIGGILVAVVILISISILFLRKAGVNKIRNWISENIKTILIIEILFLIAFAGWTLTRAAEPAAQYTEKPMELAFINSLLKSPQMPPNDPWLSDYAISYYYFGYVMVAMIAKITATAGEVAFNLGGTLWFALIAVNSYSLLFNLLNAWHWKKDIDREGKKPIFIFSSLFGPVFVLIVSNLEGLLEIIFSKNIFPYDQAAEAPSAFWRFINVNGLTNGVVIKEGWLPQGFYDSWWWWRASRLLQDFGADGFRREIINEFPCFSFFLADLHPHVLALPFVMLATVIALQVFLAREDFSAEQPGLIDWLKSLFSETRISFGTLRYLNWIKTPVFWFGVLIFGSLGFLNTWDFPFYVGLFCLVWVLREASVNGWRFELIWDFLINGILIGVLGIILYFPFYIGFSSQAGGILPSLHFFTTGIHFWLMFAVFLIPIFVWLIYLFIKRKAWQNWKLALMITLLVVVGFWGISYLAAIPAIAAYDYQQNLLAQGIVSDMGFQKVFADFGGVIRWAQGGSGLDSVVGDSLIRRLQSPGTWITLSILLFLISGVGISAINRKNQEKSSEEKPESAPVKLFVLAMLFVGLMLTLFPEFFYLKDGFGNRINTIFKFYYQAWLLWSIAAAFIVVYLSRKLNRVSSILFRIFWIIVFACSLIYPVFRVMHRFSNKSLEDLTIDGAAYVRQYNPSDYEAIQFLSEQPYGVIAEAVGGQYTYAARISTFTGYPTVLGWPGHEGQWRGGYIEMGSRETDIQLLYEGHDWITMQSIINKYNITYIVVGNQERSTYQVNERFLEAYLPVIFEQDSTKIYLASGGIYD